MKRLFYKRGCILTTLDDSWVSKGPHVPAVQCSMCVVKLLRVTGKVFRAGVCRSIQCLSSELATHTPFLPLSVCLSVHQLRGFTLQPRRRPTTIVNRGLCLWIQSVSTHQCVLLTLGAAVCKDKELMGTTVNARAQRLCLRQYAPLCLAAYLLFSIACLGCKSCNSRLQLVEQQ